MHHSNNTGLVLVSHLLTGDNYTSWSRAMKIALIVKNKLGFIDGKLDKPINDLIPFWVCCNNVVISWILNVVFKEISASIISSEYAKDIWVDLQEHFNFQIDPEFFNFFVPSPIWHKINKL